MGWWFKWWVFCILSLRGFMPLAYFWNSMVILVISSWAVTREWIQRIIQTYISASLPGNLKINLVTTFFLFLDNSFWYLKRLNLIPSEGSDSQNTTTKEIIQPNNEAPWRTLLFGTFVSLVITVPYIKYLIGYCL